MEVWTSQKAARFTTHLKIDHRSRETCSSVVTLQELMPHASTRQPIMSRAGTRRVDMPRACMCRDYYHARPTQGQSILFYFLLHGSADISVPGADVMIGLDPPRSGRVWFWLTRFDPVDSVHVDQVDSTRLGWAGSARCGHIRVTRLTSRVRSWFMGRAWSI